LKYFFGAVILMIANKFSSWEEAVRFLIDQPDQQALVQACYFDRPALFAAQRYHKSEEWNAVRELLPIRRGYALDVGSGMGIASYALAVDGWHTTALEPDSSDLVGAGAIRKLAHEGGVEIAVVEKCGECLPFSDNSFDLVHARQVLHHANDLGQFCAELFRVLKPGGRLVATREHVISNKKQLSKFLKKHPLHSLYGGENAFLLLEYLGNLKASGFSINRVLGPWDSIINSSPLTRMKFQELFLARFERFPATRLISKLLFSKYGFELIRRVLAIMDRRPGRLYTFVADKPEIVS
jgi:ubiquinone/menaquinone biosynthesis C-methylase UbiE